MNCAVKVRRLGLYDNHWNTVELSVIRHTSFVYCARHQDRRHANELVSFRRLCIVKVEVSRPTCPPTVHVSIRPEAKYCKCDR
jgi:hypothetical protein